MSAGRIIAGCYNYIFFAPRKLVACVDHALGGWFN